MSNNEKKKPEPTEDLPEEEGIDFYERLKKVEMEFPTGRIRHINQMIKLLTMIKDSEVEYLDALLEKKAEIKKLITKS